MKTKVIVTGGCGFIGSHVVDLLIEKNFDVHVVDNISTSKNNKYIHQDAVYLNLDITQNVEKLKEVFNGAKYIFHLAAFARVIPSIHDPVTFHNINVNGSLNVFLAAKEVGAKIIFSSSSSVYGNPIELPVKETHRLDPMCPYALHKQIGEEYLQLFNKIYSLNSVSLRYFNVFGERAPREGAYVPVVGIFLRQKEAGESLTIVGDGLQNRDFVHAKDVARANLAAALDERSGAFAYNVGSGKSLSVIEIADKISKNIVHIPERFEYKSARSDVTKIKKELGWEYEIELMQWLEKYV